jgi:LAGLIDADG-like domain
VRTISREVVTSPDPVAALTPQRLHAELLETSVSGHRAYLLGALHDGTVSKRHGTVRFGQSDVRWLKVLERCLALLGQRSWLYREGARRRFWVLETSARWLDDEVSLATNEQQLAYARGYFDAEGGVPRDLQARFYIQFVQKDREDLGDLRVILEQGGIRCGKLHNPSVSVDAGLWRFYVLAESQRAFIDRVGSWHPRKRRLLDGRRALLAPG